MLANVFCTYVYEFNEDIAALGMFNLLYYPCDPLL
jgi:hypothetical protein